MGRHTDGSEYLMTDGHVKYFKQAAVSAGSQADSPTDTANGNATAAVASGASPAVATGKYAEGTGSLTAPDVATFSGI